MILLYLKASINTYVLVVICLIRVEPMYIYSYINHRFIHLYLHFADTTSTSKNSSRKVKRIIKKQRLTTFCKDLQLLWWTTNLSGRNVREQFSHGTKVIWKPTLHWKICEWHDVILDVSRQNAYEKDVKVIVRVVKVIQKSA